MKKKKKTDSSGSMARVSASALSGRAYRVSVCAVLTALALIFSYVEALIPFQLGIPGIKLGLSNLVVSHRPLRNRSFLCFRHQCVPDSAVRSAVRRRVGHDLQSGGRPSELCCHVRTEENASLQSGRRQHGGRCHAQCGPADSGGAYRRDIADLSLSAGSADFRHDNGHPSGNRVGVDSRPIGENFFFPGQRHRPEIKESTASVQ